MALLVYMFLLAFKITATLTCAYFAFRISRFHIASTHTWSLIGAAFALRVFTQFYSLAFTQDILGLYSHYNFTTIIFTQAIEVTIISLFLIALLRIFDGVRLLSRKIDG